LQSPVLIAELDHHCGVFLDYDTPKPFNVHTVLRTPHGNDYGRAWVHGWRPGDPAAVTGRSCSGYGAVSRSPRSRPAGRRPAAGH
jgi:hypothetical protein